MIVTPCPLCRAKVEVHRSEIKRKQGSKFNMRVLYSSQLMTVACDDTAKIGVFKQFQTQALRQTLPRGWNLLIRDSSLGRHGVHFEMQGLQIGQHPGCRAAEGRHRARVEQPRRATFYRRLLAH